MNIRISGYVDEFPRISSDLHNNSEFISCAAEIVEVLYKYGMRYCEAQTLLENILNLLYQYSNGSHSDMQIYRIREHFEQEKNNV